MNDNLDNNATSNMDEVGLGAAPNKRADDDAGTILTLELSDMTLDSLRSLELYAPCSYWNQLAEAMADILSVSPTDVVIWRITNSCRYLELTVPARAIANVKYTVPTPCTSLRELGVVSVARGAENVTSDVSEEWPVPWPNTQCVCLHLAERSLECFLAMKESHLSQIDDVLAVGSQKNNFRLLRVATHTHGIRLLMVVAEKCCKQLCKAVANGLISAAQLGVLRVTVYMKKAIPLGLSVAKSTGNEGVRTRDPNTPCPIPEKPDQADGGWLSWVHLRRRKGAHSGPSIYLVRGKDRGRPAWHYVHVKDTLLTEFLEKTRGGSLDVADYGEVLSSGWGDDPPADLADSIDRDYA